MVSTSKNKNEHAQPKVDTGKLFDGGNKKLTEGKSNENDDLISQVGMGVIG